MTYTKMTPEDFAKKLKGDGYKSATAARRAVGKAAFSKQGKDACYAGINDYFGEDTQPPKSKRPKASAGKSSDKSTHQASEDALDAINLADRRVGTITQALAALKAAKDASSDVDISSGAKAAGAAITDIMRGIHEGMLGDGPDPKSNGVGTATVPTTAEGTTTEATT